MEATIAEMSTVRSTSSRVDKERFLRQEPLAFIQTGFLFPFLLPSRTPVLLRGHGGRRVALQLSSSLLVLSLNTSLLPMSWITLHCTHSAILLVQYWHFSVSNFEQSGPCRHAIFPHQFSSLKNKREESHSGKGGNHRHQQP